MDRKQLELWLTPGILGFYRSCEVTVCGLLDHAGSAQNLFTILTFEEREPDASGKPRFLTEKNECFGNRIRLFAAQYRISLDTAIEIFCEITAKSREISTPLGPLQTAPLTPIPAYFVPNDSSLTVPANRLLKNNFRGSMAVEWFGSPDSRICKEADLQKAALRIRELLPIDLFTLSDHIGNVLFQFPQQIAFCKLSSLESDISCSIIFDERVQSLGKYSCSVFTKYDHALMNFHASMGKNQHELVVNVARTGGPYVITLVDMEQGIPILQQTTSSMNQIHTVIEVKGDADSVRTVTLSNGITEQIQINSADAVSVGRPTPPWKQALRQRQYEAHMKELAKRLEFVRYGRSGNERVQALEDLRSLMRLEPLSRVCLWDPYLTASDLLETWYFTDIYGKELRAITSNEIPKRSKQTLDSWKADQRDALSRGSNQFGVNLCWRVQHDHFGFPFHDRFLILMPRDEAPRVWSLGTSVNSFGKTHHILQMVSNPRYIADDFEELWAALEDQSCQIWDSKEEHGHG